VLVKIDRVELRERERVRERERDFVYPILFASMDAVKTLNGYTSEYVQ